MKHKATIMRNKKTNEIWRVENKWHSKFSEENVIDKSKHIAAFETTKKHWETEGKFPTEVMQNKIGIIEMEAEKRKAFDEEFVNDIDNWEFVLFED